MREVFLCDAARIGAGAPALDVAALKRRAFEVILEAERPHLGRSAALWAFVVASATAASEGWVTR